MYEPIRSLDSLPVELFGCAMSIGNFDGVHRGHRYLLARLIELAKELDSPSVVFTFHPSPVSVLAPQFAAIPLTTIQRRSELLFDFGIDFVIACPAEKKILEQTASQFFESVIRQKLECRGLVEGPNFRFGKDRGGDTALLRQMCRENRLECQIVEPVLETECVEPSVEDAKSKISQSMISSSRIRAALSAGKIHMANEMLTTRYQLEGRVVEGARRGRELGFPTANLAQISTLVPANGVYSGMTKINGRSYPVAIHIGPNPTFDENVAKVEIHVLQFEGNLYDQVLTVEFLSRIRGVQQFASQSELLKQIHVDLQKVRAAVRGFEAI